jgi:hypothetical protein
LRKDYSNFAAAKWCPIRFRCSLQTKTGLTEYPRQSVKHSAKQYVVGAVHTNTIEGFWSIFKRGIVGSFHKVSAKYMPLYVAECQFRYNHRQSADIFSSAIEEAEINCTITPTRHTQSADSH